MASVRRKMVEIGEVDYFDVVGTKSFIGVVINENAPVNTPLIVEHRFVFKKGLI